MYGIRRYWVWVIVGLAFAGGYFLGVGTEFAGAGPLFQSDEGQVEALLETLELVRDEYVDALDEAALVEAALDGMMDSLEDPHSFYMDPEAFQLMNNDLQGRFEGIGATVRQEEETGQLVIVSTLPGSPAEGAGILAGDAIVEVDGENITALPQSEIINLIRGPAGTEVELGVAREGEAETLQIVVVRNEIQVPSVEAELLDSDIVHIRLYQFGSRTTQALRDELRNLAVETRRGLVLDFRGNPGGYLTTAVEVASEFLGDGVVVTERSRDDVKVFETRGTPGAPTVPMVVLVDQASASASELVAGALQDLDRATIVGVQTFGKGSVQTWRSLPNGGGVRVTTARWFTPDDRSIEGVGLAPDVVVELDAADSERDTQLEFALELLSEANIVLQP